MPVPSVLTFKSFYQRALSYTNLFREYYDFLAMDNAVNVPAIENKPQGLLHLFLGKFPHSFGLQIWQKLRLLQDEHKPRPYTFETFLSHFKKELISLKKIADTAETVTDLFGGKEVQQFYKHAFSYLMPSDKVRHRLSAVATDDFDPDSDVAFLSLLPGSTVRPCWFVLNGKECVYGPRCKSSHDANVIDQARSDLILKFQKLIQDSSPSDDVTDLLEGPYSFQERA